MMNVIEIYPAIAIETNIGNTIRKNIVCKNKHNKEKQLWIKHNINKLTRLDVRRMMGLACLRMLYISALRHKRCGKS